jgi:RNA polymerase sigma-70 factor (ECF subfamily)
MLDTGLARDSHDHTELTLLQRLRGGDAAVLEVLMEQHAPRVYRVAYGITQNAADAEEVVQDVFLTLFNKIHTFEERAALGSWLYRVATNAALVKRRGRRSDREVPLDSLLPTFLPDGHRMGERDFVLCDWSRSPEALLLSQETCENVRRAIGLLPEPYRAVLILRDIEGLSNEEVAEIVGDSVAAVKSRLHRARMVLRETLTQSLGPTRAGSSGMAPRNGSMRPRPGPRAQERRTQEPPDVRTV